MHSLRNLILFAKFALLSYLDPDKLQSALHNGTHLTINIKEISDLIRTFTFFNIKRTGAQCYIFILKDFRCVVVFRGTDSVRDCLRDLDVRRKRYRCHNQELLIHSGFLCQYLSLKENIYEYLHKHNSLFKSIIGLGHSLGSICTLLCLDLSEFISNTNIECVTFGSPKIGNAKFTKLFDSKILKSSRVVNDQDIVCTIPFSGRFDHVQGRVLIGRDNASFFGELLENFTDHYMINYFKELIRILPNNEQL